MLDILVYSLAVDGTIGTILKILFRVAETAMYARTAEALLRFYDGEHAKQSTDVVFMYFVQKKITSIF